MVRATTRKEEEKVSAGRPTDYTPELAAKICLHISEGKSLRSFCRADDAPDASTIFDWIHRHSEFAKQYARAREAQAEHWADELVELADDATDAQKARLQIDTRKWVASKLLPKKYGERQQIEHSTDPEKPFEVVVRNAEELRAKIRGS